MANARERLEREAEARAADLAARKGATMRRMMVSQLYCPEKVQRRRGTSHSSKWYNGCHETALSRHERTGLLQRA